MDLLKHKVTVKGKKPTFIRHVAHQKARLAKKWRKPKGLQNKMRLHKRGYARHLSIGWGSPVALRGFNKKGLREMLIASLADVEKLNPKEDGAIIAGTIGDKKRIEIIEACIKKNITILNIKNPSDYVDQVKSGISERKKTRDAKRKTQEARDKKREKEAEKKKDEPEEEELTEDEKKAEEKKEYDRQLIAGQ